MERLRYSDLRAALDFLERIGGAADIGAFANLLVSELGRAIPADVFAYNEVDPVSKRAFFVSEFDVEEALPGATALLERHMGDNPIVVHNARTHDGSARKWSDFISRRQLHATLLWDGLFRPFSIEHQMVAVLPTPAPLLVGVVLHRCGRDFSERDRALLNLLRPHLVNAYRNAQARSVASALECPSHRDVDATVPVGALGEPLALSESARSLAESFSDGGIQRLLEWAGRMRARAPLPAEPLLTSAEGMTVEARLLAPSVIGLRGRRERLDPASLCSLGITPREREVLALVAEGRTNKEIAVCIDVRPATVKKHLERIYDKLGIHTRTAAAAAAFRASGA
ncbi:MAG: response regulator transcription factor [Actinomycetota bacterium]